MPELNLCLERVQLLFFFFLNEDSGEGMESRGISMIVVSLSHPSVPLV